MIIKGVDAKSILDSRKQKTIQIHIKTDVGNFSASSPSGKSKGKYEVKSYKKSLEEDIKTIKKFSDYFLNPETQANIRKAGEIQFQQKFLIELFVNVLGYTMNPDPQYNLTTEFKNEKGAKKADGAILPKKKLLE